MAKKKAGKKKVGAKRTPASKTRAKKAPPKRAAAPKRSGAAPAAGRMHGERADLGSSADPYFRGIEPAEIRELASAVRSIVLAAAPGVEEVIKWGIPNYMLDGHLCAIRASKAHVTLQFMESGVELDDPQGLLEGTGKRLRHVRILSRADVRKGPLTALVKGAVRWNRDHA